MAATYKEIVERLVAWWDKFPPVYEHPSGDPRYDGGFSLIVDAAKEALETTPSASTNIGSPKSAPVYIESNNRCDYCDNNTCDIRNGKNDGVGLCYFSGRRLRASARERCTKLTGESKL